MFFLHSDDVPSPRNVIKRQKNTVQWGNFTLYKLSHLNHCVTVNCILLILIRLDLFHIKVFVHF